MKFIHTADWHLGLRLGAFDLTEIQFAQIERILGLCDEHRAEILVVAGDVFEKRPTELPALTKRLAALLKPKIERGLHVILVPGNHDSREHFRMMRTLLNLEEGGQNRLHVVEKQEVFSLWGVEWGVVPYPDRDSLAQAAQEQETADVEEKNQSLSTTYTKIVKAVAQNMKSGLPGVFVGHVTVAGVETPSEIELSYDREIILGRADLPANVSYIALGHIHQKQQILGDNVAPCFYSGNLDRYNRGERHDAQKGVWLVEIPTDAGPRPRAITTWLDLPVTPFYDIEIGADEVETLPQKYPDLERAFVHVTLDVSQSLDPLKARRRIYELCPRVLDVEPIGEGLGRAADAPFAPRDWRKTALDFVGERFAGRADLSDLEQKTRELLEEVENVVTAR